jgi:hypothetical protein
VLIAWSAAAAQETCPSLPSVPACLPWTSKPEAERTEKDKSEDRSPFADAIETDRDSFTPSPKTVEEHRLVVESSFSFEDNRGRPDTYSFPELLLRYGLTRRIELRLGWNDEIGSGGSQVAGAEGEEDFNGSRVVRESQALYGTKLWLTEQSGPVPESSVIVQGFTPTSGPETASKFLVGYVFGWDLPNRWKLDASLRYETDSEAGDDFEVWAPSVVLKVPIGERWNVHAEYFGEFSQNKSQDFVRHFFSPGAHFLITPDLEVGVRVGWGLNDQSTRFFSNVGFGLRF